MSEVTLDIRQKEMIVEFRKWLYTKDLTVFTSDTFREFLKDKDWVDRLVDRKDHINVGGLLHLMLRAENPRHRIEKLDKWTASTIGSNKKRAIRKYKFIA